MAQHQLTQGFQSPLGSECIVYDITFMWNLKKKKSTNELIYKAETVREVENKLMVSRI